MMEVYYEVVSLEMLAKLQALSRVDGIRVYVSDTWVPCKCGKHDFMMRVPMGLN